MNDRVWLHAWGRPISRWCSMVVVSSVGMFLAAPARADPLIADVERESQAQADSDSEPDAEPDSEDPPRAKPMGWPPRFAVASGRSRLRLRGRLHLDGRFFPQAAPHTELDIRRARANFEGSFFDGRIETKLGIEVSGELELADALVDLRIVDGLHLQIGQQVIPSDFYRMRTSNEMRHPERPALVNNLYDEREVGAKIWGELLAGRIVYHLGVFDGPVEVERGDDVSVATRLSLYPWRNLLVGGAYRVWPVSSRSPGYAPLELFRNLTFYEPPSDPTRGGSRHQVAVGPQLWVGPVEAGGEFIYDYTEDLRPSPDRTLDWQQLSAVGDVGVMLTGEHPREEGDLAPARPVFGASAPGPGAFELAARYEYIWVDDALVRSGLARGSTRTHAAHATLTWTLAAGIRVLLSYGYAHFDQAIVIDRRQPRSDAHAIITRFDIHF